MHTIPVIIYITLPTTRNAYGEMLMDAGLTEGVDYCLISDLSVIDSLVSQHGPNECPRMFITGSAHHRMEPVIERIKALQGFAPDTTFVYLGCGALREEHVGFFAHRIDKLEEYEKLLELVKGFLEESRRTAEYAI